MDFRQIDNGVWQRGNLVVAVKMEENCISSHLGIKRMDGEIVSIGSLGVILQTPYNCYNMPFTLQPTAVDVENMEVFIKIKDKEDEDI